MFSKRFEPPPSKSFSKSQKVSKSNSSFSKTHGVSKSRHESSRRRPGTATTSQPAGTDPTMSPNSTLTPSIVTLIIGRDQRIFAAHEDVLRASPWFQQALTDQYMDSQKRIHLPDDEPEIFSSVLEYLYKGDYYPRLVHNKRRNSWEIEQVDEERGANESTIYHHAIDGDILKDTVIYCTADKYGLEELKRVSLRKQGLQSGIQCSTILASARYSYCHTPDTDSKLRAHYLALIIRSRSTFKRSGTMQLEMFNGGTKLFFDLFVALCNHVDDISSASNTPRSNRFF
ncbi:Uu.00g026890.m01.CDS01 [Anthostomella pinea]|uniref:Uu.00g026890.m01.CDS01 n=1 Tax=Anthostomella pinea TaxID=933095 RepID=A0AAI8V7L6_9PEZI|nr:Uu.00g026890.m01.CDS01 [Anthostomella pinea]